MKVGRKRGGKGEGVGDTPDFPDEDVEILDGVWDDIGRNDDDE